MSIFVQWTASCEYFYHPTFELLFFKLGQMIIFPQTPEYSHPNCDPMKFLKVFCLQNKLEKLNFLKKYSVCNCITFCIVCVYYVPNFCTIIHEIKSNDYVCRSQWIISPYPVWIQWIVSYSSSADEFSTIAHYYHWKTLLY